MTNLKKQWFAENNIFFIRNVITRKKDKQSKIRHIACSFQWNTFTFIPVSQFSRVIQCQKCSRKQRSLHFIFDLIYRVLFHTKAIRICISCTVKVKVIISTYLLVLYSNYRIYITVKANENTLSYFKFVFYFNKSTMYPLPFLTLY